MPTPSTGFGRTSRHLFLAVAVAAAEGHRPGVPAVDQSAGRHDRPSLIGFLTERDTEEALREGLAEATSETLDLRRGGIRAAIATMQKSATPRVLIVDISGEEHP